MYGLGPRAGEALVTHPKVPVLSFTGGTVTGVRIAEKAAPYCKRLSLEVSKDFKHQYIILNCSAWREECWNSI